MAAPKIKIRRSSVQGKVPTTEQISLGEIAINTRDGKLFFKKDVAGTESIVTLQEVDTTDFKILDDISSSFNGSTTQFILSSSSTNFLNSEITSEARVLISVGGVIQEPDPAQNSGFYLSGGTNITTDPVKINFVEPPKSGQAFFGIAFGQTTTPTLSFASPEESLLNSIIFGV